MVVEVTSALIGAVTVTAVGMILGGVFLSGYLTARRPSHIVNMNEVRAYYRETLANESMRQDVEDLEELRQR